MEIVIEIDFKLETATSCVFKTRKIGFLYKFCTVVGGKVHFIIHTYLYIF